MNQKIKITFWNSRRLGDAEIIARLVEEYDVDCLFLFEAGVTPGEVLGEINATTADYFFHESERERVQVYSRLPEHGLVCRYESACMSGWELSLEGFVALSLVAVHAPSKLHWSSDSQAALCTRLAQEIQEVEGQAGHQRSILFGDFNMNPFEAGVVAASGLHAVSSRQVASRGRRVIRERSYEFFYNPSWKLFNPEAEVNGTYFYASAEQVCHFWNVFDQVMVRPELIPSFDLDALRVLEIIDGRSLLTKHFRPLKRISDHLPVLFAMKLQEVEDERITESLA